MASSELLDYLGENPEQLPLGKVKDKLEVLRRKRATHRRKITIYCNKLQALNGSGTLNSSLCKNHGDQSRASHVIVLIPLNYNLQVRFGRT